MARSPESSAATGIRWSLIAAITGILTLAIAYTQTHLVEIAVAVRGLSMLASNVVGYVVSLPAALVNDAPAFLSVLLLIVVSGGVGCTTLTLLRRRAAFDVDVLSAPESLTLSAVIGLGLISIGALALGLAGLYRIEAFAIMLGLFAALTYRGIVAWLRVIPRLRPQRWSVWDWATAVAAAFVLLVALLFAAGPPVAWDALAYHLVAPQRYLEAQQIAAHPDNTYLGFSQTVETLYGVVMALSGRDSSPAILHWCFGTLGLLALVGLVNRLAGRLPARIALVLMLGAFGFWILFAIPYVDLALFALAVCSIASLTAWQDSRGDGWLIIVGICGGIALGVKYSSGLFLIGAGVVALYTSPRTVIRSALLIGVPSLILFAPWMLRGLLLWGNPVYPFVFGGLAWDDLRAASLSTSGFGMFARGEAWQLPLLPLWATILGMTSVFEYDFSAGPLLLVALAILPFVRRFFPQRAASLTSTSVIMALTMTACWMVMAATTRIGAQTRLMMMMLPAFAIGGALAIDALSRSRQGLLFRVVTGVVVASIVLIVLHVNGYATSSDILGYFRSGDRRAYLVTRLTSYPDTLDQLAALPDGSRVLQLYEPRSYDCPAMVICAPDVLFDNWGRPLRQGATPDDVMAAYREEYDYILFLEAMYDFSSQDGRDYTAENALLPDALSRWMTPLWTSSDEAYTLYAWSDQ